MGGIVFNADPVQQTAAGDWLMRARDHTGRTAAGTMVLIKQAEILEMASAEMPAGTPLIAPVNHPGSLDALENAMAAERKTIPAPSEIIGQLNARATADRAEVTKPPGRPTQPRTTGLIHKPPQQRPQWGQRT
jgi:hypothetical protein